MAESDREEQHPPEVSGTTGVTEITSATSAEVSQEQSGEISIDERDLRSDGNLKEEKEEDGKPKPRLTLKQRRFTAAYADPNGANGNGRLAARIAGYSGDDNQLGVQAWTNLRNPKIQQSIEEALDAQGCTLDLAAVAVAEGLRATKQRSFLDKHGNILSTDPEPNHAIRLAASKIRFAVRSKSSVPSDGAAAEVSREDGIQIATELLLKVASASEVSILIPQLQRRLADLESGREMQAAVQKTSPDEGLQAEPQVVPEKEEQEEVG